MIVYKTTNLVNGKIYIGKDAVNRKSYLGSGLILRRAIAKYGKENFHKELLEQCSSLKELAERETYWILKLKSNIPEIGYNLTDGGLGGDTYSYSNNTEKERRRKILIEAARKFNNSPEGKALLSKKSKQMWSNPGHRESISKKMTGREIKWKDKISDSITEWHKTNPIPDTSRKRAAKITSIKMKGYEFKSVAPDIVNNIILLYKTMGPVYIAKKLKISPYLVRRVLKKEGIYQKWQKGIGKKSNKHASISRRGAGNPMYGRSKIYQYAT